MAENRKTNRRLFIAVMLVAALIAAMVAQWNYCSFTSHSDDRGLHYHCEDGNWVGVDPIEMEQLISPSGVRF